MISSPRALLISKRTKKQRKENDVMGRLNPPRFSQSESPLSISRPSSVYPNLFKSL